MTHLKNFAVSWAATFTKNYIHISKILAGKKDSVTNLQPSSCEADRANRCPTKFIWKRVFVPAEH